MPDAVKAFKTGTFKIKNLQTIDTVPLYQSTAHRIITMRDHSPQQVSPKKQGSPLAMSNTQIRASMPAPNLRYSQKSDYKEEAGLERISSSLEAA